MSSISVLGSIIKDLSSHDEFTLQVLNWLTVFYDATRYHGSENTKLFVESSLELVWDLLGIAGSLVGMAGSLLGVAWDCWEVLEVVRNC